MTVGLQIILLLFAVVGFGGTGASLAVARYRRLADGERDLGMWCVAAMLFLFGALCTGVGVGLSGILAFGGVVILVSYMFMARQMGMFEVDSGGDSPPTETEPTEESRRWG
ncbi:MAG: hypothetical protein ACODAE_09050 [Gemmatimonadota bacterium]